MIHYKLRCDGGHDFEGWFKGSVSFEDQARRGLLSCPHCGTVGVERALMAPALRTRPATVPSEPVAQAGPPAASASRMPIPDAARALLQRMRIEVERNCDDVGDRFAEEAIRMHRGEVASRGIYGNASDDDREALADEGVAIASIPWLRLPEG